jgi:SAM-dependent methyltransferase
VGERYARGRPAYHPHAIRQIGKTLQINQLLKRALDVGCGTGNSARALREIAGFVVGTDMSRSMLGAATSRNGVSYVESLAEVLPYPDGAFDLVTVASAFHWFDRARFLPEARRVLVPNGWLTVYTTGSHGSMLENSAYSQWRREVHALKFPSPPRHRRQLDEEDARAAGFKFVQREPYHYTLTLTLDEFVDSLTTQSNVIAAVDRGDTTLDEARAWLLESLKPVFVAPHGTFPCEGTITYLRNPA